MPPVSPAAADTARLGYRDNAGFGADGIAILCSPHGQTFCHGREQPRLLVVEIEMPGNRAGTARRRTEAGQAGGRAGLSAVTRARLR
jgi:hypothetical protein